MFKQLFNCDNALPLLALRLGHSRPTWPHGMHGHDFTHEKARVRSNITTVSTSLFRHVEPVVLVQTDVATYSMSEHCSQTCRSDSCAFTSQLRMIASICGVAIKESGPWDCWSIKTNPIYRRALPAHALCLGSYTVALGPVVA